MNTVIAPQFDALPHRAAAESVGAIHDAAAA